jgi:flagellar assembly protein FliH
MDGAALHDQTFQTKMGPAEVIALIRAHGRAFTPAPLGAKAPAESGFVQAGIGGLVRPMPEPVAETALRDPVAEPVAPVAPAAPAVDPAPLIAAARAEGEAVGRAEGIAAGQVMGHAAGVAEGRAMALAEQQAGLDEAREIFLAAARRLDAPSAADTAALAASMEAAVRALAAKRAGQVIDISPKPFMDRIEALAERVSQGLRSLELRLHPGDLAAITPFLPDSDLLTASRLVAEPRLSRGDVDIRADGIRLADLLQNDTTGA